VFVPAASKSGHVLREVNTTEGFGPSIELASKVTGNNVRIVTYNFRVPQIASGGETILREVKAELKLFVPFGSLQSDVDDIVGYVNGMTASGTTNSNDILVGGVGIF
jgi:hypothetical protein